MRRGPNTAPAFAWEFKGSRDWLLCQWSEPSLDRLLGRSEPPSAEARCVSVRMIREKDYQAMRRRLTALDKLITAANLWLAEEIDNAEAIDQVVDALNYAEEDSP